ncbi:MBL fold metallo-hydrolase [Pseudonocardia ailaonensis]|uniref:MBL fold metallo-hydrolase n=1 Tax=Pseudonocardia ailaonensis TaxID=367279 RepID=A0ABN2MTD1_9PSEU
MNFTSPLAPVPPGVEVVGTAQRQAWADKVLPPVERLDSGIWSIPVPIPRNPLRYTLTYLVPGDHGLVVVDPGWSDEDTWAALTAGLETAGATFDDVVGIVATHTHPDHHGLSGRLAAASGAWIAMHRIEADLLPQLTGTTTTGQRVEAMGRWMCACGASEDEIDEFSEQRTHSTTAESLVAPTLRLEDGDILPLPGRRLQTVWTPGHTPGHICLLDLDAGVMLTGDHILPRITPNIGLSPQVANAKMPALAAFLKSLEDTALADEAHGGLLALPAHEYRFRGLANRARGLQSHHEARCRELLEIVTELGEPSVWEVTARLTWSRPWEQVGRMKFGALAETSAHIAYLADRGELEYLGDPLADGEGTTVRVRLAGRVAA